MRQSGAVQQVNLAAFAVAVKGLKRLRAHDAGVRRVELAVREFDVENHGIETVVVTALAEDHELLVCLFDHAGELAPGHYLYWETQPLFLEGVVSLNLGFVVEFAGEEDQDVEDYEEEEVRRVELGAWELGPLQRFGAELRALEAHWDEVEERSDAD